MNDAPESQEVIAELEAETQRWLADARDLGLGYRVWRSPMQRDADRMFWTFRIIAPDEGTPDEGLIFQPPSA